MIYGTTVLVIDDEKDICNLISDILQDEGFRCTSAKDSSEAIEKINKAAPNLILLDIWLQNSDLDGLGVLEWVKNKYPNIPVIKNLFMEFLLQQYRRVYRNKWGAII